MDPPSERKNNRATGRPVQAQRNFRSGWEAADFESFLADLSSAFIRVSVEDIDHEIERRLEQMVLALDIDRGTVIYVDPADGALRVTHQFAREGVLTLDKGSDSRVNFPWYSAKILSGEILVLSSLEEAPPEAHKDRIGAVRDGTKSNVTIPFKFGGVAVGAVSFGTAFSERRWAPEEVQRLKLVAEIFGNALERKRAEAEIRRLSEELRQVSQVVTMGELTAALAHEIDQPLTAILSNVEAVREMVAAKIDPAQIDDALEDIIRDDRRAVEIVRDVRALFKRDETKSMIDLKELLIEVDRIARSEARMKGISLALDIPDSLPSVFGNKTHLIQGILNLVFNAFDSVSEVDGPREVSLLASATGPDQVRVSVRDSGKGIDPKVMPRLFEPFFTTKPTGMGMGLAIVLSIIDSHGGRIWATPNADRGATLQFTLPVKQSPP